MKALDVGCGIYSDEYLLGAETAENNAEDTEVTHAQYVSSDEPLPVPNNTYDLIWYSNAFRQTSYSSRKGIVQELTRVAKQGATLILKDYCEECFPEDEGDEHDVPHTYWLERIPKWFKKWRVEATFIGWKRTRGQYLVILRKD